MIGTSRHDPEEAVPRGPERSVHEEINAVQLKRVKQLLADSDLPLKLVAKRSGFGHRDLHGRRVPQMPWELPRGNTGNSIKRI